MNWGSWLLWGFVATVALTTVMAGSQGLRLTRINLPYMLGAMFTPSRDRATLIGFGVHLVDGWLFSLIYIAAFNAWGRATWWADLRVGASGRRPHPHDETLDRPKGQAEQATGLGARAVTERFGERLDRAVCRSAFSAEE